MTTFTVASSNGSPKKWNQFMKSDPTLGSTGQKMAGVGVIQIQDLIRFQACRKK
jgi:hypothetical protein